ncbi:TetR/AcrR family transcriptional regulator [Pseudonocardia eucalypti]|uniref:TetR/AcrR family transcriptional regulator n=1 Tax=Pseudonocardia eucalypti TaxID=648755 RepID=A0ABP9Q5Q1_9PSEU|nr:AcrR family transcriptional regulator [Pseudonocardia eucalypti]
MSDTASVRASVETGGMRERLIEATVRLLAEEGPGAVQARRITREVGATTMAVYHHFGGMPQLLAAVRETGFDRLHARLVEVPTTDDPTLDLYRQAMTYREVALEHPNLYDLMFGMAAPGGQRPAADATRTSADRTRQHLLTTVQRAMDVGYFRRGDADAVTAQLWTVLHGYVMLELAGHFADLRDSKKQVFLPLSESLLASLGADTERMRRHRG